MPPHSYIHEFPHPRFVIHYHQNGDFSLGFLQSALQDRAHGLELDLNFRSDDDDTVVCNEGGGRPDSPTLVEVLDYILNWKGSSPTVHNDDYQFFLVLDIKEATDALHEAVFQVLRSKTQQLSPHLSTAAEPDGEPRGITIIVTSNSEKFYMRHPSSELNRLCITDSNVSYTHNYSAKINGTAEITNLSPEQTPFQWVTFDHSNDQERGLVNEYHSGPRDSTGQYNVRTWGGATDEGELRLQLATGADSVNWVPTYRNGVNTFEEIIHSQAPRGFSPSLATDGTRALLTWHGADSSNLYTAAGTIEQSSLLFPRQLNLTYFLEQSPQAKAPAVALGADGQLVIAYEGTDQHRIWYVSGHFASLDRFLTFEGGQHRLTLQDDVGRLGSNPSVAFAPDGRIVIVYEGTDNQRLWYVSGYLNDEGELIGPEYSLTEGDARRGYTPSIVIDSAGGVIVIYRGTDGEKLWYVSGALDNAGRIVGSEFSLTEGDSRRGSTPHVAIGPHGHVLVVYRGTDAQRLWYISGTRDATGRIVGPEFSLTMGDARRGTHPTAGFDESGNAVVLYTGTAEGKLWYVQGAFDQRGELQGEERLLDMSFNVL